MANELTPPGEGLIGDRALAKLNLVADDFRIRRKKVEKEKPIYHAFIPVQGKPSKCTLCTRPRKAHQGEVITVNGKEEVIAVSGHVVKKASFYRTF